MTDAHVLDNGMWSSLNGRHAHLAEVHGSARRYPTDVSPFYAVDGFDRRAWDDLAALAGPDGVVVLFRATTPTPPDGWTTLMEGPGHQMVVDEFGPTVDVALRELTADDVPRMLELTRATKPGPFLPRTIEMGTYWGYFEDDALLAMAGERMQPDGWTEISAVCTAQAAQGRGLGAAVTKRVADTVRARGLRPFLHVAGTNHGARRVYERIGFTVRRDVSFVALRPPVS
jgi:ribosomal protein S18 acetylase RimI-like enzyme